MRVVKGDEKGTWCLGCNWATLSLGGINTGTCSLRLGIGSETDDLAL
jgi:predicted metal-binding membrane protein